MDDDPLLRLVETKMSHELPPRQRDGVLGGIGRACYRHRWLTLLSWILGVACLITMWTRFGAAADNSFTGILPKTSRRGDEPPAVTRVPVSAAD
jgi:hypothetical protein